MAAILVIDPSATVRETLRIVLEPEHAVVAAPTWDDVADGTRADLVVVGASQAGADDPAATRPRAMPDAPLLVLASPATVDVAALGSSGRRVEFLPQPFDPWTLRARIVTLLAPVPRSAPSDATVAHHRRWLTTPLLTSTAAELARRATLTDLPVLITGEPGSGAGDVVRAIHFFSGNAGRVIARAARHLDALAPTLGDPSIGALLIEDVSHLPPHAQADLVALLRETPAPRVRVFATSTRDLGDAAAAGTLAAELVYALGALAVALPPLRERSADLSAIVAALVPPLTLRLRLAPVSFTDAALWTLQHYLWFGNVAELEAVLARTLAVHRPRVVEPDMLLFDGAHARQAIRGDDVGVRPSAVDARTAHATTGDGAPDTDGPAAPTPPTRARVVPLDRRRADNEVVADTAMERTRSVVARAPSATSAPPGPHAIAHESAGAASAGGPALEIILGELAHELRNPMVTVKTFAQHLDAVLADPEERARFATLTEEAIARMDGLLETLLDFARFRAPVAVPLDLAALLARVLDERTDELARRGVRLEHALDGNPPALVVGDEQQMLFALRCLVDAVIHDAMPRAPLRVAPRAGGVALVLRADRAVATRLAAYVADADRDAGTPPLALALATALIRRNDGRLETDVNDDGTTTLAVTLPRARGDG